LVVKFLVLQFGFFLSLFFEFGITFSGFAVTLAFGISLSATDDFIVNGIIENLGFFCQ